jgi:hypothetical protein
MSSARAPKPRRPHFLRPHTARLQPLSFGPSWPGQKRRKTCARPPARYSFCTARVVKWQTRTFEGRMPQGMGVQVPPRALFISARPNLCRCSIHAGSRGFNAALLRSLLFPLRPACLYQKVSKQVLILLVRCLDLRCPKPANSTILRLNRHLRLQAASADAIRRTPKPPPGSHYGSGFRDAWRQPTRQRRSPATSELHRIPQRLADGIHGRRGEATDGAFQLMVLDSL